MELSLEDLSQLFGSVRDRKPEPSLPGAAAFPAPPPVSGESDGGGQAQNQDAADVVVTQLFCVPATTPPVCLGYIGDQRNKFCMAQVCVIQNHEKRKFRPKSGLFIRVPRKMDQCFCQPFLSDNLFSSDLAADFLSEERSVEAWTAMFAQIIALNSRLTSDKWKFLQAARDKAQELKTPIRAYKSETEAFHMLASLWSDLEDFRHQASEGEDTSTNEFRLLALENQIELLANRLE